MADGDRDHLIHVHGVFGNGMTRTGNASCLSISRDVGPDGLAMGYKEVSVFFGFAVHPASFRDFRMPLALWQMLDADGWCLMMVLYMVLSDILAERRMARRTQVRCKGCFTFTGASLADSGLLQSWFVSVVAVHVIFPFVLYLGKNGGTQARRWRRRGERQHAYEQTKKNMPQKMTATCHTRPKASHHKYKAAGINERQQEHKEPGAKILMNIEARTAGWRSSLSNRAGWISSLSNGAHWRKPNKMQGPGAETSLQQPQHHSRRKLTLSNVLFQFLLGVRRGRVGEENAL